jgi:Flp pilus assembly protein TadD
MRRIVPLLAATVLSLQLSGCAIFRAPVDNSTGPQPEQSPPPAPGQPQVAIGTIERALRIEPDNPLLWVELGKVHEDAGHFDQAAGMGHKALQLATGDPRAQSASWHLIADSLKARGRNGEAAEAQRRADQLVAQ